MISREDNTFLRQSIDDSSRTDSTTQRVHGSGTSLDDDVQGVTGGRGFFCFGSGEGTADQKESSRPCKSRPSIDDSSRTLADSTTQRVHGSGTTGGRGFFCFIGEGSGEGTADQKESSRPCKS